MNKDDLYDFDVMVIGGGASGMMAAGRSAELGKRVLLLEKNRELGKKLKITGGGRCNITNAEYDEHTLLKNYGKAEQFLYSPFSRFGVKDTFKFFEDRGLPLVVQAGKRSFPKTEKALDVYKVLEKYLSSGKVVIKTNVKIKKILHEKKIITGIEVEGKIYKAKSYILATGGASHPETGSTGDGFRWLEYLGHDIKPPSPTVVPIAVSDKWIKAMPGTVLAEMKITFYVDGKKKFSKEGNILCTHFGISGPLVLNFAEKVNDLLYEGEVTAKIDLYPKLNEKELEQKIIKIFDENKNKNFKNALPHLVPSGMTNVMCTLLNDINPETKVHSIKKEARKDLRNILKNLPLHITGLLGFDKAVVVDGGVSLKEVDTITMRSKIISNLFVTGDLLHINRKSGGYSLQICWTSGYLAGSNA